MGIRWHAENGDAGEKCEKSHLLCHSSSPQRLDGSIKGEIRKQALDHFNAEGSEVSGLVVFLKHFVLAIVVN